MFPESINGKPVPYGDDTDRLVHLVQTFDPSSAQALAALAREQDPQAREALLRFTESPNELVRRAAIEALSSSHSASDHATTFLRGLEDPSGFVVRTACESVAKLRFAAARPKILSLLTARDDRTRVAAFRALEVLGTADDFNTVLECFCREQVESVRRQSAFTLRALVSPGTWKTFFELFSEQTLARHKVWACEVFREHGEGERTVLLRMLQDPDGHVRKAAAQALNKAAG